MRQPLGALTCVAPGIAPAWHTMIAPLVAAILGLIRIFFSDYMRLKKTAGLSHYEERQMLERLRAAGFNAARAEENIGHNQRRMTFVARPK